MFYICSGSTSLAAAPVIQILSIDMYISSLFIISNFYYIPPKAPVTMIL